MSTHRFNRANSGDKVVRAPADEQASRLGLPPAAYAYLLGATVACGVLGGLAAPRTTVTGRDLAVFAFLVTGAALAQAFVVVTPRNQAYHTSIVFVIAAALLLPIGLVLLVAVVQHIPEWIRERYRWYIQTFNICNYALDAAVAWAVAVAVERAWDWGPGELRLAAAGAAAAAAFVVTNHVLLAGMLKLARAHTLRSSGLFTAENLGTDLVLASVGVSMAGAITWNPWFAAFALAPLVLVHRSLSVPKLVEDARIDAKTGLWNARHFWESLGDELGRASRVERPVAVLLADLDLLRDVNNVFGHLVGDRVLADVARQLRDELRAYDVPCRFGGEEFTVVLPETSLPEASAIAERLRRKIASLRVSTDDPDGAATVTISIGVAAARDGETATEVVHRADAAVYEAKRLGRDRVVVAK